MSAQTKRMQLSRDQRAVLEAVYAIEKLPDASLRERLGSYLSLTTRQIQVSAAPPGRLGTAAETGPSGLQSSAAWSHPLLGHARSGSSIGNRPLQWQWGQAPP